MNTIEDFEIEPGDFLVCGPVIYPEGVKEQIDTWQDLLRQFDEAHVPTLNRLFATFKERDGRDNGHAFRVFESFKENWQLTRQAYVGPIVDLMALCVPSYVITRKLS